MFKKYLFLIVVSVYSSLHAMEKQEKGKEKEENPLRICLDSLSKRKSAGLESPRSILNANCLFLSLPDEILVLIILQILEGLTHDFPDEKDLELLININRIYTLIGPFGLSCITISTLIPEAICDFYLIKLDHYQRSQIIQVAQDSYRKEHFSPVAFFLTALLKIAKCKDLYTKSKLLKKLLSEKALSIENNSLSFKLGGDKDDNKELVIMALALRSDNDNFITLDAIFHNVLLIPNNKKILKWLVNLEDLGSNSYISTDLMKESFNGNVEAFDLALRGDENQLYTTSPFQLNAIIWAVIGGNSDLLDYIFNTIPIEVLGYPNTSNQNLIHYCALYGRPKTLRYVLSKLGRLDYRGIPIINLKDTTNFSPLCRAIQSGSETKTLILLNNGADLEAIVDCDLLTLNSDSTILKMLVENKSLLKKLAQNLPKGQTGTDNLLSSEDIIECFKKCKKEKRKVIAILCTLASVLGCLILYGES